MYDDPTGFSGGVRMHPAFSHNLFGCPCCADTLPTLMTAIGADLSREAERYRTGPGFPRSSTVAGERLLVNARILTMNPEIPEAEALLIRDGRVVLAGATEDARARASTDAVLVDCEGRVLLPGPFIPTAVVGATSVLDYGTEDQTDNCSEIHITPRS